MPTIQSLDDLISRKAAEFADHLRAAAAMADKEEEIRAAVIEELAFIQKEAGITLEKKHEFTIGQGRADSVYSRVIIEYKNPKSPADRIGPGKDSPGCKKVVDQLKERFRGLKDDHGHPPESLFGVGLDGNHFVFVRFRDKKWDVQDPVEVNKHSATRFPWALFNLGQKGKRFSPEYLAGDFAIDKVVNKSLGSWLRVIHGWQYGDNTNDAPGSCGIIVIASKAFRKRAVVRGPKKEGPSLHAARDLPLHGGTGS